MLGEVVLEEGKIYLVKVRASGSIWLFKKHCGRFSDKIAGCNKSVCLDDMSKYREDSYVCRDNEIEYVKPANENYIAIWNRVFNDNVELR